MQRYRVLAGLTFTALLGVSACLQAGDTADNDSTVEQASFGGSLGSVLGSAVATNNTAGLTNDHAPTCGSAGSAPDIAYSWTAPATGTYTFTTVGSADTFSPFDTILEIRNFTTNASLGCKDDSGGTLQSTVSVALTIGQTVRVVVDGYGSAQGTFRLGISGPPGAPGRNYRCGYAQAGFGCNNGRGSSVLLAADMTSAISQCHIAQPANLPDFCYVLDADGATASDQSQCVAQGGSWRPNTSCCNFVGSVACPN